MGFLLLSSGLVVYRLKRYQGKWVTFSISYTEICMLHFNHLIISGNIVLIIQCVCVFFSLVSTRSLSFKTLPREVGHFFNTIYRVGKSESVHAVRHNMVVSGT